MYTGLNIIIGKPHSGKSHLIRYLVREICFNNNIDIVILFSKSSHTPQYDYICREWQHPTFNTDKLQQIFDMQRSLQQQGLQPFNILLIFDDCIDKKNQTQLFLDTINNHRHLNITIIYSLQYMLGNINCNFREVVNKAFIFRQDSDNAIKGANKTFLPWLARDEYDEINYSLPDYHFVLVNKDEMAYDICIAPAQTPSYFIEYKDTIEPKEY